MLATTSSLPVRRLLGVVAVLALGCAASEPDVQEPDVSSPDTEVVDEEAGRPSAPGPSSSPDASSSSPDASPDVEAAVETRRPDLPALLDAIDGFDEAVVGIAGDDGHVLVDVKVAAEDAERRRGLMEVPELPDGVGMLFLFDDERTGGFWMKDTRVPLDIAFVADDGTVAAILAMEPCTHDPCPVYEPGVTYTSALEVRQGWFAANGVDVGDVVVVGPVAGASIPSG